MKKYLIPSTLISAVALATPAFADEITITFEEQNNPAQVANVAWSYSGEYGYYVGTKISSGEITFEWGELWNDVDGEEATIMNQQQHPLDQGTIVPYNDTNWTLSFTITATEDIEISYIAFQLVGAFNGGSFDNAVGSASTFTATLTAEQDGTTTLYSGDVTVNGTSLAAVQGTETDPEKQATYDANYIVMNFDTITLQEGDSITFTLTMVETGNNVRAGIQSIVVGLPEPSMFSLLFGLGAIGLVATRRRRRA